MKGHGRFSLFAIIFGVFYTIEFYLNWTLFRYYPLVHQFHILDQPTKSGPPISWYGWIIGALIVGTAVAFMIPPRWSDTLSPRWSWIVPTLVIALVLVYEKRWFV